MKQLIILSISLIVIACSNDHESVQIPDEVIPFEKMSDIMLDVQLMESQVENQRLADPSIMDSIGKFYAAVFQKHNVQKVQYDSSLVFYAKHFRLLDSLYNNVFTKLHDLELEMKDIEFEANEVKYLTRDELLEALQKTKFSEYLKQDNINFIDARDSLKRFTASHQDLLDSLKISAISFKNSFNLYCNSQNKFRQLTAMMKEKQ